MPKFQKGHPKHGGRKKGQPNKVTLSLQQLCAEKGIDPFAALLDIAQNSLDETTRFQALKEVVQYLHPKRKAIEHSGELDLGVQQKVQEYLEMDEEELVKIMEAEVAKHSG